VTDRKWIRVETDRGETIEAPDDAKVGDRVVYLRTEYNKPAEATIARIGSDYDGPCRRVIGRPW
jgi:hypothetical protein